MGLFVIAAFWAPNALAAQGPPVSSQVTDLDSLVALARAVNPEIDAARHRVAAAQARIGPASTLPDPMLGVGVMNLPLTEPGFGDMMTMATVAVGQMVPFPGKLSLARAATERELEAAEARLRGVELDVTASVQKAYFDLVYADRVLQVLENSEGLLVGLTQLTESRYGVGVGSQQEVLVARVQAALPAETAVSLAEERRGALARLNALLDRPSATPIGELAIPERVARAAISPDVSQIRFASESLGSRVESSPLPQLEAVQERALQNSPALRAHEAEIAAQTIHLEQARKAHLPDFDLSVQYGLRTQHADMASFMISVPVPIHRSGRQAQDVLGAQAELAALQAQHHAMVNQIRSEVAEQHGALERDRAHLALFIKSVIPQGRAALESATVAFQTNRGEMRTVIESQATLYEYEIAYQRALTDFAAGLAELERIVGAEVLP